MIHRLLILIAANLLIVMGAEAQDNYFGLSGTVEDCYTRSEGQGQTYEVCHDGRLRGALDNDIEDQVEKLEFMKVANEYFLEERRGSYEDSINMISFKRTLKGVWWQDLRKKTPYPLSDQVS